MKNPFNPQNLGEAHLKRNVFDLGRNSIFTNDFFRLYPFFCQEILPGDTVRIDAQIGVRGMPTVFPVQTKCRASMEFYYVRDRTLMDNFEDYIFMTKDIEAPWIRFNNERAKKMISIGSLGDAFNIPTTIGESADITLFKDVTFKSVVQSSAGSGASPLPVIAQDLTTFNGVIRRLIENQTTFTLSQLHTGYTLGGLGINLTGITSMLPSDFNSAPYRSTYSSTVEPSTDGYFFFAYSVDSPSRILSYAYPIEITHTKDGEMFTNHYHIDPLQLQYFLNDVKGVESYNLYIGAFASGETSDYDAILPYFPITPDSNSLVPSQIILFDNLDSLKDATDDSVIDSNPFVGDNPAIRINALPWRAYEMICNYYYRNDKNNPYVLNGESQYNEFIPTHASGPDDNLYDYHYRNWELDRFTSAIQSPQFGEAPLVGLTYSPTSPTADLTFQGSLDGGETKDYTVKVGVNSDGDIDSIVDFDSDVPSANLQRLQRQIQAGISINDLRITNSFQRFLENTIRRGLRYRNQLKSHFGVSVDYPDIDVPQYIGGASGFLESGQVTNMADSPNAGLGDYVGTLQGGISMRNKITHYCAEHGFIIGIFSLAPIPNYPQSISKVMIKTNPLDYYLPEFGKIGYVPIHYSELMPLQTPADGSVDDVFGYQKAHYDYMQAFDEIHGDFRKSLAPFVLSRTFKERPLLSSSFTVGSPDQLNDIWVANNIADAYDSAAKFMCSSHVSCIMKREVAMIGTPSLE